MQVIVTLSEQPKEFKKGNLSITDNATISKEPEALTPIAEDPNRFRNLRVIDCRRRLAINAALRSVGLYDPAADGAEPDYRHIHDAIVAELMKMPSASGLRQALNDAVANYNVLATASWCTDTAPVTAGTDGEDGVLTLGEAGRP